MASDRARAATLLTEAFFDLYPGEATEVLEGASIEDIVAFLETQPTRRAAIAFERLSPQVAADCLPRMTDESMRRILSSIDPGDVAVVLSRRDESAREQRLALLDPALAKEL
ncbi:MAG: hypothetical protein R3268_05615, partial [Acidiferrobacterales bacterium]|nr:hypothetical protein [Acidiferrobacterales bacterium]